MKPNLVHQKGHRVFFGEFVVVTSDGSFITLGFRWFPVGMKQPKN